MQEIQMSKHGPQVINRVPEFSIYYLNVFKEERIIFYRINGFTNQEFLIHGNLRIISTEVITLSSIKLM